ncbi:nuclear transport factor 2 family protein [Paenibacillus sp. GSMTC-2017]|uniref:nuclear transport factor 2 family protein n=1 Tax=Paenibacillus sp. GSMTC-2017 TaxID=2794350 RepID=UPI002FBD710A
MLRLQLIDIHGIIELLHKDVTFRNFSNGEMNVETRGIEQFKALAEKSAHIFSSRRQTITGYSAVDENIEVQINYEAILASDLPNGLKIGDMIQLQGKTVFRINEGKISLIEDYS